jgi:hypothetical protein
MKCRRKSVEPIFTELEFFTPKSVTKLSKIWVEYLRSDIRIRDPGKNLIRILDPGVKQEPDPESQIRNTGWQD